MKKRFALAAMLCAAALILSACAGSSTPQEFEVANNARPVVPTQNVSAPADIPAIDFDSGAYDPTSEEGILDDVPAEETVEDTVIAAAPQQPQQPAGVQYAGATPVVIDPIDKPTPTPAPALAIDTYQVYDATKLGLSFEGPVGWSIDDSASDSFTIWNPDTSVLYPASLTIRKISVSADYTQAQLKTQVNEIISAAKGRFNKFTSYTAATRTLMDKEGVYNDYHGVEIDSGAEVYGRVHAVCLNRTLYILDVSTPREYWSTPYKDALYGRFRHTVKITK